MAKIAWKAKTAIDEQAAQEAAQESLLVTNRLSIEAKALLALQTNRNFIALTAPTNAQTLAEVKALARQNNGIIRLLLNKLDGTD